MGKGIVSFGCDCEKNQGEQIKFEEKNNLQLISQTIKNIRSKTKYGKINLHTFAQIPENIKFLEESGLDSITVVLNSFIPIHFLPFYNYYLEKCSFHPISFENEEDLGKKSLKLFKNIKESISIIKKAGKLVHLEYLVYPGINDKVEEIEAINHFIDSTPIDSIHFKNLTFDPHLYLRMLSITNESDDLGLDFLIKSIKKNHPNLPITAFIPPK